MSTQWTPFESSKTVGQTGTEGGRIIRDDEHRDGARITLEQGCRMAPFAITCGIYGWMVHSAFYADQMTAEDDFARMQARLDAIVQLIPRDDAADMEQQLDAVEAAIRAFVEEF